ncbi:MAG: hypothetical protein ABJA67_16660 [Chthonomonadales bacterium]
MKAIYRLITATTLLSLSVSAISQIPRINTFFPIGGKAGQTIEVEVRGSNLTGADKVLVNGPGLSGIVDPGITKPDEQFKPVFQSKCGTCHELRSPANRSMTPQQWADTVDRMVRVRQAPLSPDESKNVSSYLQGMARAGRLTAKIKIDADVVPGLREIRLANSKGASTACLFEVGNLQEILGFPGKIDSPQDIKLPCVANGSLTGNSERHYYRFEAKQSERIVFNLKGYRFNESSQMFFNPNLRLYDATGKEIAESHGYFDLDPLIDWTAPAAGTYTLEVRDLLGRGNPGSVYRLAMGTVSYDTVAYPPAVQGGKKTLLRIIGKNIAKNTDDCEVSPEVQWGITTVPTPMGSQQIFVTPLNVVHQDDEVSKSTVFPCGFTGKVDRQGKPPVFSAVCNTAGNYEFEVFASRLGSPYSPSAQILNDKGQVIGRIQSEGRGVVKLVAGQSYQVKMDDAGMKSSPENVFYIEARQAGATVHSVVRPDCITVRPGMTTAAEVRINRRDRAAGVIQIVAEDLPPGVTAKPVIIPPDRNEGYIVFECEPGAIVEDRPIRIITSAKNEEGGWNRSTARPQETYLLNNNPRYIDRSQCILSVRPQAEFVASVLDPGPIRVHPKLGLPLKVSLVRKAGFKSNVLIRVVGLPSGWVANQETIGPGKEEITLTIRPDGNNTQPFMKRDAKLPPIICLVEAVVDDYPSVIGMLTVLPTDKPIEEDRPL